MINGVLVERTVKDVQPALETNSEGLKKVLEELVKQYKRQQEEMEKWKVGFMLSRITLLLPWAYISHTSRGDCPLIFFVAEEKQYTSCPTITVLHN